MERVTSGLYQELKTYILILMMRTAWEILELQALGPFQLNIFRYLVTIVHARALVRQNVQDLPYLIAFCRQLHRQS